MRKFKPESWSQQARRMCWNQLSQCLSGDKTEENCVEFFSNSYRASIIRIRAAKKFGRELREINEKSKSFAR